MKYVDENGRFVVTPNTLKAEQSEHPVHKARVAVALGLNSWLHAPNEGHTLGVYAQSKATDEKSDEFQKVLKLYLAKYGPEVTQRFISRGKLQMQVLITRETING